MPFITTCYEKRQAMGQALYGTHYRSEAKSGSVDFEMTEQTHIPYVVHAGDWKEEGGIIYLPLYMPPLL